MILLKYPSFLHCSVEGIVLSLYCACFRSRNTFGTTSLFKLDYTSVIMDQVIDLSIQATIHRINVWYAII